MEEATKNIDHKMGYHSLMVRQKIGKEFDKKLGKKAKTNYCDQILKIYLVLKTCLLVTQPNQQHV